MIGATGLPADNVIVPYANENKKAPRFEVLYG